MRDLELDAALRANGDFFDSAIPTGLIVAHGHAEFDIGVRDRLSKALSAAITVRNIGDDRFQDAVGFPAPGRIVRLTILAGTF